MMSKRFHEKDASKPWAEFEWARPSRGAIGFFAWVDGKPMRPYDKANPDELRWLVMVGAGSGLQRYQPLVDEPTLFRVFADVEGSEEGFRRFADAYGVFLNPPLFHRGGALGNGIPLARMKSEHAKICVVLRVLDAVRDRKRARLIETIDQLAQPMAERARGAVSFKALAEIFMEWAAIAINNSLRGHADDGDAVVTVLRPSGGRQLRLAQVPRSLLGALWLQCARFASGDQELRRCEGPDCGDWFLISPTNGKRKQAIYCGPACNVRACRFRKRLKATAQSRKKYSEEDK